MNRYLLAVSSAAPYLHIYDADNGWAKLISGADYTAMDAAVSAVAYSDALGIFVAITSASVIHVYNAETFKQAARRPVEMS